MNNPLQAILNGFLSNRGNQGITPTQQNYIDTIQSGNADRGQELADNLCKSMGMTREEAIDQARKFFHI